MMPVERPSARTILVSFYIENDNVPIVDQNASVGFFQLQIKNLNHVLGHHDNMRPLFSDWLLVVQSSFLLTASVESIAYPLDDHDPNINKNHLKCIYWPLLRTSVRNSEDSQQSEHHHAAHSFLEYNDGRIQGNLNDTVLNEDNHDLTNYAVFKYAQQV